VEALTSGERRAVGQQPGAFISGDKRQGHGQNPHGTVHACGSTDAQAIASVEDRKRGSAIAGSRKDTDAIPRFCGNP
ncbi:hypothetical protein JTL39_35520, partial [Pseudomonas aeruginosa]|nr:hypothetical protein [Pseudomonas aeruginosa]